MRILFVLLVLSSVSKIVIGQEVTIGTQVWSTENLDVTTFRNGDSIPQARTEEEWKKAGKSLRKKNGIPLNLSYFEQITHPIF